MADGYSKTKPLLLSHSDNTGGASIAAYRAHQALLSSGIDSKLWVNSKGTMDPTVESFAGPVSKLKSRIRTESGRLLPSLLFSDDSPTQRSFNLFNSKWVDRINNDDSDIVNVQWVHREMMSIKDIGRISKPMVLTMQDMWSFCGAEHYTQDRRWSDSYSRKSRRNGASQLSGFDIDRWTWLRKKRYWNNSMQIVAISRWLADCAANSSLFANNPITVIPNPIDVSVWKPMEKTVARRIWNLPENKRIITFGAVGGTRQPRKGYAFLDEALERLRLKFDDIHLVVYGQSEPSSRGVDIFPTTYVGSLKDSVSMCVLNNASDVYVHPALQEAFGQTVSEAQACGVPVVAFDSSGVTDIVNHKSTGYLAQVGSSEELAKGIEWVFEQQADNERAQRLANKARRRIVEKFSYAQVGEAYLDLFSAVLDSNRSKKQALGAKESY